ncbi:MAG: CsbD family protein [Gammaproteobacteria bacterium]|nr:CsbD family protein [Gammaproteobacteria bacterium]
MNILNGDQVKAKWKQYAGDAKVAWGKLTDDELLQIEGNGQKLAGLVQERYALSREDAEKQVEDFFKKNQY